MANVHFSCFDIRLAESITKSGQLAIRWVGRKVNEYLNNVLKTDEFKDFVVYTDTDSIYVDLSDCVERMGHKYSKREVVVDVLDKFGSEYMEKVIEEGYKDLFNYTNSFQQQMVMKREVISDNSIFVSKKRYAMSVWNSEGVAFDKAKIKVMGMDMVKSSTPQVVRDAMKDVVTLLLNGKERDLHTYVSKFYGKFNQEPPQNIAFPRGVNKLAESYCRTDGSFRDDVTCPINSRAAIVYNQTLDKYGLNDYERIVNGDKIKYIHLELPNKLHQDVIGFIDYIPPELGIDAKVDYEMMFYKTFKKPMETLTDVIGWTLEPKVTLNMLFGASMYQDEDFEMPEYDYEIDEEKDLHNRTDFDSIFRIDYDSLGHVVGE